jgi:hypothetical protein
MAFGFVLASSLPLPGCQLDRRPIGGPSDGGGGEGGMTVTDGGGGMGGDGGIGGEGGMGGGPLITGSQYIPGTLRPSEAATLPPTRAFFLWQNGDIPSGRTLEGYRFCLTTGPATEIDEDSECPDMQDLTALYLALNPLTPNTTYRWKVRARYDGGHYSEWSSVRVFSSDDSLVAWLPLNGDAMDSSTAGNDGTLENGVGFGAGIDGQALQCDGSNDYSDLGSGLPLSGPLTISAWIFGNGTPVASDSGILAQGGLNYALTYHTSGEVYFYIGDGGNNLHAPVSPSAWHHVMGTFNGTTSAGGMRFYLDGVSAGVKASSTATTGAAGDLWIGRYASSYFDGLIDNVTIYDASLSAEAMLNEYCATQAVGGVDPISSACLP